jgi:hypothetical protein
MKNVLLGLGAVTVILGVIAFGFWWQIYKYQDCLRVGHSKLYCVMKINSN